MNLGVERPIIQAPMAGVQTSALAIADELGPMSASTPAFPLAGAALAPLRAEAERRGSDAFTQMWSGRRRSSRKSSRAGDLNRQQHEDPPRRWSTIRSSKPAAGSWQRVHSAPIASRRS